MASTSHTTVRIGVPFRTLEEEQAGGAKSKKLEFYYRALREAGAEPVAISLAKDAASIRRTAESLDGFVLTGSPADVDPACYNAPRDPETHAPDPARETADRTLLDHAIAAGKPVLAICYGTQHLNVHLGGTLVQNIGTEPGTHLQHEDKDGVHPEHPVRLEPGSRLAPLAAASEPRVNSAHHQSIRSPGRNLRVTAHAPDGVVEAVEWTGDANWIVGVQWHPERMEGDSFAAALFRELVAAARHAEVKP
ncbi:MAG TPA: gamma-glutamyl-gamma-aminobutyrate hydrolase family protein [Candidatus Solibacter sp.]|nr:gamma-glutamyl-gamma-aminobutyrate hydrolase family protein [Candidatus Solibacter sp.]